MPGLLGGTAWQFAGVVALRAALTLPNVGSTVTANLYGASLLSSNAFVFITDPSGNQSVFQVQSISDANTAVLINCGGPGASVPGTIIATGATGQVIPATFNMIMTALFGGGDSGAITPGASGTTTLPSASYYTTWNDWPSGSTATYVNNATFGGFGVFAKYRLSMKNAPAGAFTSAFVSSGGNASGNTAGSAGSAGFGISVFGAAGLAGVAGGTGVGTTGTSPSALTPWGAIGNNYSKGGAGGAGTNAGGLAGTGTTNNATFALVPRSPLTFGSGTRVGFDLEGNVGCSCPGGVGGAGGGSGSATGGASGGSGTGGDGIIMGANEFYRDSSTAALSIVCNGGNAGSSGNGAAANCGGGGGSAGGSGGAVVRGTCVLSGSQVSSLIQCDGGTGGTGGNGGTGAAGGTGGTGGASGAFLDQRFTASWSSFYTDTIASNAGTAGNAASGTSGGSGGAGGQGRIAA